MKVKINVLYKVCIKKKKMRPFIEIKKVLKTDENSKENDVEDWNIWLIFFFLLVIHVHSKVEDFLLYTSLTRLYCIV